MADRLVVRITASGVREALAAFRKLPKDASKDLRDASVEIAKRVADSARSAGQSTDAQSAAVASTVRPARDRVPAVQAGGAKRVTSRRVPASQLLFGSEFGADGRYGWYGATKYAESEGRQFAPHQGREGRWFFPTVEREQEAALSEWWDAVDTTIRKFTTEG